VADTRHDVVDPLRKSYRLVIFLPMIASQTCADLSNDAVTIRVPSGLNAAEFTAPSRPSRTKIALPVAAPQTRAVLSAVFDFRAARNGAFGPVSANPDAVNRLRVDARAARTKWHN
jgi:hypothetical protein